MNFNQIKKAFRKSAVDYYSDIQYLDENEQLFFIMIDKCENEDDLMKLIDQSPIHSSYYCQLFPKLDNKRYYFNHLIGVYNEIIIKTREFIDEHKISTSLKNICDEYILHTKLEPDDHIGDTWCNELRREIDIVTHNMEHCRAELKYKKLNKKNMELIREYCKLFHGLIPSELNRYQINPYSNEINYTMDTFCDCNEIEYQINAFKKQNRVLKDSIDLTRKKISSLKI